MISCSSDINVVEFDIQGGQHTRSVLEGCLRSITSLSISRGSRQVAPASRRKETVISELNGWPLMQGPLRGAISFADDVTAVAAS